MSLVLIKSAKKKVIKKKINRVKKLRHLCKKNKQYLKIIDEHNYDSDIIDGISIRFCDDIENTAKTINGEICINSKLLDANPIKQLRYIIHELVHVFQHIEKEGTESKKENKYLDNPDEIEAFQAQLDYQEENEDNLEKYIKDLFDFHKIPEKDRPELLDSLVKELDDKSVKEKVLEND